MFVAYDQCAGLFASLEIVKPKLLANCETCADSCGLFFGERFDVLVFDPERALLT